MPLSAMMHRASENFYGIPDFPANSRHIQSFDDGWLLAAALNFYSPCINFLGCPLKIAVTLASAIASGPPKAKVGGSNPLGCANHFNDLGFILPFYDFA